MNKIEKVMQAYYDKVSSEGYWKKATSYDFIDYIVKLGTFTFEEISILKMGNFYPYILHLNNGKKVVQIAFSELFEFENKPIKPILVSEDALYFNDNFYLRELESDYESLMLEHYPSGVPITILDLSLFEDIRTFYKSKVKGNYRSNLFGTKRKDLEVVYKVSNSSYDILNYSNLFKNNLEKYYTTPYDIVCTVSLLINKYAGDLVIQEILFNKEIVAVMFMVRCKDTLVLVNSACLIKECLNRYSLYTLNHLLSFEYSIKENIRFVRSGFYYGYKKCLGFDMESVPSIKFNNKFLSSMDSDIRSICL